MSWLSDTLNALLPYIGMGAFFKLGKDSANAKARKKNNDARNALRDKRMRDKRK